MEKIIVFGTGSAANEFVELIDHDKVKIIAFINSDESVKSFCGYDVIIPETVKDYEYDYIVIASGYVHKITEVLLHVGVKEEKIVSYIYDDAKTYQGILNNINIYLDKMYNRGKVSNWMKDTRKIPMIYPATLWKDQCILSDFYKDFVREQTMSLVSNVICENEVRGAIAELGVFRGDFTIIMDRVFQRRKLYLFDTFEGFVVRDVEADAAINNETGELGKFKDTSVEFVLSRLSGGNEVIVKKGYFPDTFDLSEEMFAFVSIDLNLYDPVKSALELFYPRMEKGGYILVSDYLAPFYEGTKKAVDDWSGETGVKFVPVADFYGSVLIVKE